jgi:antitoxin component YwqK of YwqJK toxin-antitoxin module
MKLFQLSNTRGTIINLEDILYIEITPKLHVDSKGRISFYFKAGKELCVEYYSEASDKFYRDIERLSALTELLPNE